MAGAGAGLPPEAAAAMRRTRPAESSPITVIGGRLWMVDSSPKGAAFDSLLGTTDILQSAPLWLQLC